MYVISSKFFTSLVNVWFISFLLWVTLGMLTHSLANLKLIASLSVSPVCAEPAAGGDSELVVTRGHGWPYLMVLLSFKQQHFFSACLDLRCVIFFLILFVSIRIPLLCFQVFLLELFTEVPEGSVEWQWAVALSPLYACPAVFLSLLY